MDRHEKIKHLKKEVYEANKILPELGLVKLTWGNVSTIDRELGVVIIKPSGVSYDTMRAKDMVVLDLEGNKLEEGLNPSSDLKTHLYLYEQFPKVNAIVHTHSKWAVAWASASKDIPIYNTTHADTFNGAVPCTEDLSKVEVEDDYELNTGVIIAKTFKERKIDYLEVPGVITAHHGPFTWGESIKSAVENSIVLDEIADMAIHAQILSPKLTELPDHVLKKHYERKHGKNAYYGQSKK